MLSKGGFYPEPTPEPMLYPFVEKGKVGNSTERRENAYSLTGSLINFKSLRIDKVKEA